MLVRNLGVYIMKLKHEPTEARDFRRIIMHFVHDYIQQETETPLMLATWRAQLESRH